jgi:hypothetical protein
VGSLAAQSVIEAAMQVPWPCLSAHAPEVAECSTLLQHSLDSCSTENYHAQPDMRAVSARDLFACKSAVHVPVHKAGSPHRLSMLTGLREECDVQNDTDENVGSRRSFASSWQCAAIMDMLLQAAKSCAHAGPSWCYPARSTAWCDD